MLTKEYNKIDGIKSFINNVSMDHTDYNAKGLDNLYEQEEKHFWFISRKKFILQNMKSFLNTNSKIIEIGAGTGNVSRFLQKNGYCNLSVGEMHISGLKYAKSYGIKDCYQFDLLDVPFKNEFDAVCMFDVLEHIDDDNLALQNINQALKKNGTVVLTVPSHNWLWSRDDTIAAHKRRYIKKELCEKIEKQGFEILTARYFFISIVPLLYLRTLLKKDNENPVKIDEFNNNISINFFINKILLFISNLENKINKFLPNKFGGSLFLIARKK